jgi:hypothetical protein
MNLRWAPTNAWKENRPASLAGFLFLKLNLTLRFALFLSLAPPSLQPHLLNLITQTPGSFQPGLVQHRIVWRLPLPLVIRFAKRATLILNTLGGGL